MQHKPTVNISKRWRRLMLAFQLVSTMSWRAESAAKLSRQRSAGGDMRSGLTARSRLNQFQTQNSTWLCPKRRRQTTSDCRAECAARHSPRLPTGGGTRGTWTAPSPRPERARCSTAGSADKCSHENRTGQSMRIGSMELHDSKLSCRQYIESFIDLWFFINVSKYISWDTQIWFAFFVIKYFEGRSTKI